MTRLSAATPILEAAPDLNLIHKFNESNGDTWDPFWADDDNLYAFNCDGRGFGKPTQMRNLAFDRLTGASPASLVGAMVNSMDVYGQSVEKGPDHATWKALGQECIDSTFYAFVSRHTYGYESGDPLMRQTVANASLIKSVDRGLTWSRPEAENYKSPMWPGRRFGAPYFIHYGKNGGTLSRDGADRYVYAVSNNGFWNDGDDMVLSRVPREELPRLLASDWTYYQGGDGANEQSWSPHLEEAKPVISMPGQCGTTSPCYIPSLDTYVMVLWYNPVTLKKWFEPTLMKYDFYQAEHPWGPWKFISSRDDTFIVGGHWYGPTLCPKFQTSIDAGCVITLFTSGCPFDDTPDSLYKAWELPVVLRTAPVAASVLVNDDDPRIHYSGDWTTSGGRGFADYKDNVHYTKTIGDSLEFIFTGTQIDYIAEKFGDESRVEIAIDGKPLSTIDLRTDHLPRLSQITVLRSGMLARGTHHIRVINRSAAYAIVDAFCVYQ